MADIDRFITVGLNPAVDRVIEAPHFTPGAHQQVHLRHREPAGKAINVSRALAMFDRPSLATGFVGAEEVEMFDRFLAALPRAGLEIERRFVPVAGRTRENVTLVDPAAHVDTHLREAGFEVTSADLDRLRRTLGELAGEGVVMCFCGSLPPGVDASAFADLLRPCIDAGARVAVDTSGEALGAACALPLWLVKPNADELGEVTGADRQHIFDGAATLAANIDRVLVSLGADGARLIGGGSAWAARLALNPNEVVNTVGCGDCLLGGFLSGLADGLDDRESLIRAVAAATANAASLGVAGSDVDRVRALGRRVEVEPWTGR